MKEIYLNGRLGNCLFILAHYLSKYKYEKLICNITKTQISFIRELFKTFDINYIIKLNNKNSRNYKVKTFFSEKYFDYEFIRQKFIFNITDHIKYLDSKLNLHNNDTIGITIRRGDYLLLNDIWIVMPFEYYIEVYNNYFRGKNILISSDDINWCKEKFGINNKICYLEDYTNDPIKKMYFLSKCKHHINSCSSFSWWCSWINEKNDSLNVFPNKYYNLQNYKGNSNLDDIENINDMIPDRWIKYKWFNK